MVVGDRQAYGNLAVVLLAELAAILTGNANRTGSFLRVASIVDDPGTNSAVSLNDWHDFVADCRQHCRIRPVGFGDQVVQ